MNIDEKKMGLVKHLTELRNRIIWILAIFVIVFIASFMVTGDVVKYFEAQAGDITFNVFAPADALKLYMQFAFVIALVVTFPFILYHIWKFVSPGLREKERKSTGVFIIPATLLFMAGLAFGYYVLFPMLLSFMVKFAVDLGTQQTFGLSQYFSTMFNLVIPLALLCELPVVVMFLTRLRILNPMRMAKIRGYAYIVLVIIGTAISPPDFISDFLVIVPLVILYEVSIFISRVIYRKQLLADEEWENEFYSDEENSPVLNLNDDEDENK